jgi:hypothetical protein
MIWTSIELMKRLRVKDVNATGTSKSVDSNTHGKSGARKKPYAPPVPIDWGTLEDLTQSAGWTGKNDGGRFIFTKTG